MDDGDSNAPPSLPHTITNRIRWDMACVCVNCLTGYVFLHILSVIAML